MNGAKIDSRPYANPASTPGLLSRHVGKIPVNGDRGTTAAYIQFSGNPKLVFDAPQSAAHRVLDACLQPRGKIV
jgi:ribonuclease BN (tRNA processing enzyme)